MKARSKAVALTVLAGAALLGPGIGGCGIFPVLRQTGSHIAAPARGASVLVVILEGLDAQDRADFRLAVAASARAGEHLIVIDAANGTTLGSFTAPSGPAMTGPALPQAPPRDATSFQRAAYRRTLAHARAGLAHDLSALNTRERLRLRTWATGAAVAVLTNAARPGVPDRAAGRYRRRLPGGVASALTQGASDVAVLRQTGLKFGTREVIAIIGAGNSAPPPQPPVSLDGMTLVVAGVADAGQDAAWQADLLQDGASRAFVLNPATGSQLAGIISTGLDGRVVIAFQLARIRYRPAQYDLPSTARPALEAALRLLTVDYPGAIATINGYTDTVAVPGGNLLLSWRRARAVLIWLIDHGVEAGRLQAVGHGSADPEARNQPGGQSLNRRVVIIITPGGQT